MLDNKILDALNILDVSNNDQWTADGLPRLDVLEEICGMQEIKREHVTAVAPNFTRYSPFIQEEVLTTYGLTEEDCMAELQDSLQKAEQKVIEAEKELAQAMVARDKALLERDKLIEEQGKVKHPHQNQINIMMFLEHQKQLRMERATQLDSTILSAIDQALARKLGTTKSRSIPSLKKV